VNYQIDGDPEHLCELSEQAFESTDDLSIEDRPGYVHIYAIQVDTMCYNVILIFNVGKITS
jgi:hypothetical protein